MTVLSAHTLRIIKPVEPFVERTVHNGLTYGLSHCGYDVRIAQDVVLFPGDFRLAHTIEHFGTPTNCVAFVYDKSTWARRGLSLFNTVVEPGWKGHLTLELSNNSKGLIKLKNGDPIAQIVYHKLEHEVHGYRGKYQNQPAEPVGAILE